MRLHRVEMTVVRAAQTVVALPERVAGVGIPVLHSDADEEHLCVQTENQIPW